MQQRLTARAELFCTALLVLIALAVAAGPAEAGRGVVIDNFTSEIWADAGQGDTVLLPFSVHYGSGPHSNVTVQLPTSFGTQINGLNFAVVGLTFSATNTLFATVNGGTFGQDVPGLRLSNETETSTPMHTVSQASYFQFGNVSPASMAPPPFGSPGCDTSGIAMACYGPMTNSALFHFVDLSSTGNAGDFELILECGELCGNIGFNLAGLSFSADTFNPANAPSQLASYSLGQQIPGFHQGTWDFVFRNSAAVPEPSTWSSMLLGFGLIGFAFRRGRRLLVN